MISKPCRLVILREPRAAEPLRALLAARGYAVDVQPVTRIEPAEHPKVENWAGLLATAGCAVFTSAAAVEHLARGLGGVGRLASLLEGKPVAGLGSALRALHAAGAKCRVLVTGAGAMDLGRRLAAVLDGPTMVVHACGEEVQPELGNALTSAGHRYERLVCYRTVPIPPCEQGELPWSEWAAAVIAAPSAVRAIAGDRTRPAAFPFVAIGPTTAHALARAGMLVAGVAESPDAESVAEAVHAAVTQV